MSVASAQIASGTKNITIFGLDAPAKGLVVDDKNGECEVLTLNLLNFFKWSNPPSIFGTLSLSFLGISR